MSTYFMPVLNNQLKIYELLYLTYIVFYKTVYKKTLNEVNGSAEPLSYTGS